jgi:hypothetical protein
MNWGIFKGFNAKETSINNWQTPVCPDCNKELHAWIDWISHGAISYCTECKSFYSVRTITKPSVDHSYKLEIEDFICHNYHRIEFNDSWIQPQKLWEFYNRIPTTSNDIYFWILKGRN